MEYNAKGTTSNISDHKYAPVMELVDMRDLGSRAAMRAGSSPFRRTINRWNRKIPAVFSYLRYRITEKVKDYV